MLSRRQQIYLKRAQAEACLSDGDYRDSIAAVAGMADCRSSKDPRLTNEHWDALMKYFEAIFWRVGRTKAGRIFRQPGFWAERNRRGGTSRDRFTEAQLTGQILSAEQQLHEIGFGLGYCQAIQNRIQPFTLRAYLAALQRTLASKCENANAN